MLSDLHSNKNIYFTYLAVWVNNILALAQASVAQWLEHWSSKPGVERSILSGGRRLFNKQLSERTSTEFSAISKEKSNLQILNQVYLAYQFMHWV